MRTIKHALFASTVCLAMSLGIEAADFKVIANPSVAVSAVSPEDLKSVFLETKVELGSAHVVPVLAKSGNAHDAFLKECIGKSDSALATYYRSLVFTGKGSVPKALASDSEVVDYVAKTKGAVGYVAASTPVAGAKTLEVK